MPKHKTQLIGKVDANIRSPPPATATPKKSESVYTWLNSLSAEESELLHAVVNEPRLTMKNFLPPTVATRLAACTNTKESSRSGKFYLDWVECHISTIAPNKNGAKDPGHPRIRITIPKSEETPPSPVYASLRDGISPESIEAFKRLGNSSATTNQVRIGVHHIAYNKARACHNSADLQQCGAGASVSHLCHRVGCVRPEHLEFVGAHGNNTRRQRCVGITLVIGAGSGDTKTIVGEQLCRHAGTRLVTMSSLDACCRRLNIVGIGRDWPELDDLWGDAA